jgi:hypothetical protein
LRRSPKSGKKTAMEPLTFDVFRKFTIRDKFSSAAPEIKNLMQVRAILLPCHTFII